MVRRAAVLLVDDDDSHREALVWLTGLDVVAVRTGAEAIAHLRGEPAGVSSCWIGGCRT